jgi:hypothetical protein
MPIIDFELNNMLLTPKEFEDICICLGISGFKAVEGEYPKVAEFEGIPIVVSDKVKSYKPKYT